MLEALMVGFLCFDSAGVCANGVDYPIDVVNYENDAVMISGHRNEHHDLCYVAIQGSAH